jgi:alpha-tubulin suppressor-like RCC1 family protein
MLDAAPSDFTLPDSGTPTHRATAVATGRLHTCAIESTGGVECWGDDTFGQLGFAFSSTTVTSTPAALPVPRLRSQVTAIAAGAFHTCALLSSGDVDCWGANEHGQIAITSTVGTSTPTKVMGLGGPVTALAAGSLHTCAIAGGAVLCWGAGKHGQLGNGAMADSTKPVAVSGLQAATAISAGGAHTCALLADGVHCWGFNGYGQLGDGSTTDRPAPVAVSGISKVTAIAAGNAHTCALANGAVACWGYGQYGQLGQGADDDSPTPVQPIGLDKGVTGIGVGSVHSCAIVANGTLYCWGNDTVGQLGNNDSNDSSFPVAVWGLVSGVSSVVGGLFHTCALIDGAVWCFGWNLAGQLGDDMTAVDSPTPVEVVNF